MIRELENVAICRADSRNVRVGEVIQGEGGWFVPVATETEPGCFVSGVLPVEPGCLQVAFPEPVWSCPDIALGAAEKIAGFVAA